MGTRLSLLHLSRYSQEGFDMKDVVIIGVGIHKFGRFEGESYLEIGRDAAKSALQDAGVDWKDIQAAYYSKMYLYHLLLEIYLYSLPAMVQDY